MKQTRAILLVLLSAATAHAAPAGGPPAGDSAGGGGGGGGGGDISPAGSASAIDGTGAAGVSDAYSRGDHKHALTFSTVNSIIAGANASIDVNAQKIVDLADPTSAQDAATKAYVDANAGGISDGDKGDVTVSSSGATWNLDAGVCGTTEIADDAVTYAKLQNVSATDRILGRVSAGAGNAEELVCTDFAQSLLDDVDAAAARSTLGLGSMAVENTSSFEVPLTFSTGLTRTTNTITVNSVQSITRLSNLTSNGCVQTSGSDGTLSITSCGGGGSLTDGDKGDITVASSGADWQIDSGAVGSAEIANGSVAYADIQDVSTTDRLLGRVSSGAGSIEEIACTDFAQSLLDDADATAARTTLGLGSLATLSAIGSSNITDGTVALADMANLAQDQVIGRVTASTGVPETFTVTAAARTVLDDTTVAAMRTTLGAAGGTGTANGTNTGDQTITLTGDVTGSGTGSFAATIANDAVTNAKAANMANATIKCRNTAGTGDPEDCTAAQVTALLPVATTSVKGLLPTLSNSATQYLDGTGNWSTPAGGGGSSTLWYKDYMADQMLPVGSGWNTTAMADLETYNLVNVIAYDPTTSQSRGFEIVVPTGATTIDITADGAAAASGFTSNNGLVFALECRPQYGTGSFTSQTATAVTLTDNNTIQRKTFSYTVSGVGLTAGTVGLCQWTRLPANASDTMTQDWRVAHIGVAVN